MHPHSLNPLAGHAPLTRLRLCFFTAPSHPIIKDAVIRLLERAQQGSRLTIEVSGAVFCEEEAAKAVQEAARARLRAGVPGGVPALVV
jgi:hypothetical protein